jgi:chromosome segregation ATPase
MSLEMGALTTALGLLIAVLAGQVYTVHLCRQLREDLAEVRRTRAGFRCQLGLAQAQHQAEQRRKMAVERQLAELERKIRAARRELDGLEAEAARVTSRVAAREFQAVV